MPKGGLMKSHEVISSLIWLMIGVMIGIASIPLKLGLWRHPGAGLFPFLIGCAIVLVSFYQVITQILKGAESFKFWLRPGGIKRIIGLFFVMIFYAVALQHLGYLLCTFVFFIVLFKTIGQKSWGYATFTSLTICMLSYGVFQILLKVNLPKGPLGL